MQVEQAHVHRRQASAACVLNWGQLGYEVSLRSEFAQCRDVFGGFALMHYAAAPMVSGLPEQSSVAKSLACRG